MSNQVSTMAALTAATEHMKEAGIPLCGIMVSYNVRASGVERTVLRDVFARAGYGTQAKAAIPTLTAQQALTSAIAQIHPPRTLAVLRVPQPADNCPTEYAVWRGNPEATSKGNEKPTMGARVRINASGVVEHLAPEGVVWPLPELPPGESYTPEQEAVRACMGHARALATRANRLVSFVETNDVTGCLQSILAEKFFGAKFSEHGRGHFVLARFSEQWTKLMDLLTPYGVHPITLPVYADGVGDVSTREAAREDFTAKIKALREKCAEMAGKTGPRGVRADSVERAIAECITLVNTANMYADILGTLKAAVESDVKAVQKCFADLQAGHKVTYGEAQVKAAIMGMAQESAPGQADPPIAAPFTTPDGTKVIPSTSGEASA